MSRLLPSLLVLLLAAAPALAQSCPGENFFKNDILPDNPTGSFAVAVIQGLCEGEAAAQVFALNGAGLQQVNKVSVGFGHIAGAQGATALFNVEIYDGITWAGNTPTLGPKVFDLENDLATSMQVTTHGINEIDLSQFGVEVGNGTTHFVVAFRSSFNPNGSCAAGHPANFFTDATGTGSCTTIAHTSLMDIQGQGWTDAKFATVLGFPLCPTFFNGNFVIRACTIDIGGTGDFIDVGNNLTGFFAPSLAGSGSLAANGLFTLTFAGMPLSTTGYLFFDISALFLPFKGGVLVPGTTFLANFPTPPFAFGTVDIPAIMPPGIPSATSIWAQGWFPDAGGPKGASASNGLQMVTP